MGYRFYACYEEGGRIDGYAVYRVAGIDPADHWRRGVFLEELCTLSDVAYTSLWRYLLGIDLTEELRTGGRPVDEPVRYLFEDQRQFRTAQWGYRTWVRLVDVEQALALRRYEDDGALVVEVEDPFCPWNDGRFAISVDGDGVASVERVGTPADLVVTVEVLSSLYLGGVPVAALVEVGRLAEARQGATRRAERMFTARRPPFCTSHF
jgi:predicted acetyltransferase